MKTGCACFFKKQDLPCSKGMTISETTMKSHDKETKELSYRGQGKKPCTT